MTAVSTTRTGRVYSAIPGLKRFKTNLKYASLLSKAVERDDRLAEARLFTQASGRQLDDAFASPTTLSPASSSAWSTASSSALSTAPSSPQVTASRSLPASPTASTLPSPLVCALEAASADNSDIPDAPLDGITFSEAHDQPTNATKLTNAQKRRLHKVKNARKLAEEGGPAPKKSGKLETKRLSAKRRRGLRRQERQAAIDPLAKRHKKAFARRHSEPSAIYVEGVDALEYAITKGAYTVKRMDTMQKVPLTHEQLDDHGFASFDWDGITPYAILDAEDRIIAVLVGRPAEDDKRPMEQRWEASMARLASILEDARTAPGRKFTSKQKNHRRGAFTAVSFGVSYGGGQTKPMNLRLSEDHQEMVDELLHSPDLQRVAGFGSESLASYFPKAYEHMCESLVVLYKSQPELKANFMNSAYPTATLNLGPNTACVGHNDCSNFPSLACAITALGSFDPDKGGHIYFWDLKLKVRFPPGSTILLSSAGMRHGNLPLQPGEKRYSFTQYCPGGSMRWVRHGLKPANKLSHAERARLDGAGGEGWQRQLARLSTWHRLQDDRQWLLEQEKRREGRRSTT